MMVKKILIGVMRVFKKLIVIVTLTFAIALTGWWLWRSSGEGVIKTSDIKSLIEGELESGASRDEVESFLRDSEFSRVRGLTGCGFDKYGPNFRCRIDDPFPREGKGYRSITVLLHFDEIGRYSKSTVRYAVKVM